MNLNDKEDTTHYKVVVNEEGQYSVWFADRENPLGWQDAGKSGTKANASCISKKCGPVCALLASRNR